MRISVFTKPWKNITADELGETIRNLGFNGIEFPLRPGFQVEPDHAVEDMPKLVETLGKYGISITSIASELTEPVFAAAAAAGVPILRIMANVKEDVLREKGYYAFEDEQVAMLESKYALCEKYNVKIGVQNHYGAGVFNTMELRHLIDRTDPRYVGAIWDSAHSALSYEVEEQAIDIIYDRCILVNLKNAYVRRYEEDGKLSFKPFFCPAQEGARNWGRIVAHLKKKGYAGDYCMPAEYTEMEKTEEYLRNDVAYLKNLLNEG